MAFNDVDYNEHPDKGNFERKWLSQLMKDNIQQGIYVASSGGRFLGRANLGWPDPDPKEALQALRKAVADYRRLGAERRLSRTLDPAHDRLKWEHDAFAKPAGTLDLRISSRGYAFPGMTSADQRHPMYYHVDRLWFKPSEWKELLPARLAVGAKANVAGPTYKRIAMLSHMQAGSSAWWEEHIRAGKMTSEVVGVSGEEVNLRISAHYDMKADSQWCKDTFLADLLAYATYNRKQGQFTKFELATLGTHTVGQMQSNLHVGSPTQRIAAYATLNPNADDDDRMIPQSWKYGYSLGWCRAK